MTGIFTVMGRVAVRGSFRLTTAKAVWLAVAAAAMLFTGGSPARAALIGIQGTMSNFDVFNETGGPVFGAELELDGLTPDEVTKTYPCHFTGLTSNYYSNGTTNGTRLTFSNFNFNGSTFLINSTNPHNTNGHFAVNQVGCEHFGFMVHSTPTATVTQPTASRFWWLDTNGAKIGAAPLSVPLPTWSYNPPAVAGNPWVVQAVIAPVPPPPAAPPVPDAVWVTVFTTEVPRAVDLNELISGGDPAVSPQLPSEVESEWVLLGADVTLALEAPPANQDGDVSIVRRYEYYKYTGSYDPAVHLPTSAFDPLTMVTPADILPYHTSELGDFIGANMSAAVLAPEPASGLLLLFGLGVLAQATRRRRI
jgi:hypothetical protein